MLYILPLSFKVSVENLNTEQVIIKDAETDLEGLVELLHRFLDLSGDDFRSFYENMRDFEVETYSVYGEKGSEDPWVIKVVKLPVVVPREGFWKRFWLNSSS